MIASEINEIFISRPFAENLIYTNVLKGERYMSHVCNKLIEWNAMTQTEPLGRVKAILELLHADKIRELLYLLK